MWNAPLVRGFIFLVASVEMALSHDCTSSSPKPSECRLTSSSDYIYNLTPDNFKTSSGSEIIMKYDLDQDPKMDNKVNKWDGGRDIYHKTAYDYTRWDGPLGLLGPLGPFGVIGKHGALPHRFIGSIPDDKVHEDEEAKSYWNNWCVCSQTKTPTPGDILEDGSESASGKATGDDDACVYGPYGPLGEKSALDAFEYYHVMYHLQEDVCWYGDLNHNLDVSGVWGTQGPLGVTGPMGVLGALGPLGISLQYGMTTSEQGVYTTSQASGGNRSCVVRNTQPLQYSCDASEYRVYGLYEMYSRQYALALPENSVASAAGKSYSSVECQTNQTDDVSIAFSVEGYGDTSFGVDASMAFCEANSSRKSLNKADSSSCAIKDEYHFSAGGFDQYVHINAVPYGGLFNSDTNKGEWVTGFDLDLSLWCMSVDMEETTASAQRSNRNTEYGVGSHDKTIPQNTINMKKGGVFSEFSTDTSKSPEGLSSSIHSTEKVLIASATMTIAQYDHSKPPVNQEQTSLMPFLGARLRPYEVCTIVVQADLPLTCSEITELKDCKEGTASSTDTHNSATRDTEQVLDKDSDEGYWTGYYLFVTGAAVSTTDTPPAPASFLQSSQHQEKYRDTIITTFTTTTTKTDSSDSKKADDVPTGRERRVAADGGVNPDLWGPRLQADGSAAFNVYGDHQKWIKF